MLRLFQASSFTRPTYRALFSGASRSFQNLSEYHDWRENILKIRLDIPSSNLQQVNLRENAQFLHTVEPLAEQHLHVFRDTSAPPQTPRHSLLACMYPLATDDLLRYAVSDLQNWSSFRLAKFYEAVDALTGDVAYAHATGRTNGSSLENSDIALVTAGHYHSRKLHKTNIHRDLYLRCYATSIGKSSMEIRTDVLQFDDRGENEILLNVCHTVMVALDRSTMKSLSSQGKALPPLLADPDDAHQEQRAEQAERHKQIRTARQGSAMQLRLPVSHPPTLDEMRVLHECYRKIAHQEEQPSASQTKQSAPRVRDFTFRSSHVIYPEQRNVHGKLFGGYTMEQAQNLAQYAATFFGQRQPNFSAGH